MLLASLALFWDSLTLGALVDGIGDIIVNQSMRIILSSENVTHVRDTPALITSFKSCKRQAESQEKDVTHARLWSKLNVIENKLATFETNFLQIPRQKRGVTIVVAVGTLVGLATTNISLYAALRTTVKTIQESLPKLDVFHVNVDSMQESTTERADSFEELSTNHSKQQDSLDIFLLLDQMYLKVLEVNSETETFIQDLVLANSGHVTSTLLPIHQLIKIIHTAKGD